MHRLLENEDVEQLPTIERTTRLKMRIEDGVEEEHFVLIMLVFKKVMLVTDKSKTHLFLSQFFIHISGLKVQFNVKL